MTLNCQLKSMNLTNEILLINRFLIMYVLLYYLHFVFYCTHVRMSYVLNFTYFYMRLVVVDEDATWYGRRPGRAGRDFLP